MGTAATGWLISKVLNVLADDFVAAYVSSKELGLNAERIKQSLKFTSGLLEAAQKRGVGDSGGLGELVQELSAKAHEADDALDELHYFIIEDQLNNTKRAVPDLGDDLLGHARHGHHAVRHTVGNWLTCLSCSCVQDDDNDSPAPTNNPCNASNPQSSGDDGPTDTLPFDRVAMSKKIKSVIGELTILCESVSKLLSIDPINNTTTTDTLKRSPVGSMGSHKLYGRSVIFEKTVQDITIGKNDTKSLSVLPIVGPGGIGKTTFAQHLYKDERIKGHFAFRIWVSVPTDFDLLKLSQQILNCIQGSNSTANQITSLDQVQQSITRSLESKRILIVFDDIWECNNQDWDNLLAPFKEGVAAKGNMVLVTTRIPFVADKVKTTHALALTRLDPDEFFTCFEDFIYSGIESRDYRPDLTNVARQIAKKLKGSPLAAKMVGRLLRQNFSQEHWMGVLEHNKWQEVENSDSIMSSLKISYDCLPFHLKKCFPYFSLFPEDYRFKDLEITYFWIAIGVINKEEKYMEEFMDNGFLVKENDRYPDEYSFMTNPLSTKSEYYVLHDLLHELSRSVSSQECLNIYSSESFRSVDIPPSIRYLSITMEDRCDESFRREMIELKSKIDIKNLRALMIFGEYRRTVVEILDDTFKKIERLRVLFIVLESLETLPHNFSDLVHLRCLKISTSLYHSRMTLPITLSKFYHLKLLDLVGCRGVVKLPKDINRLINLRHLVAEKELYSNVSVVGKMKSLRELKQFDVKKECAGFELSELGTLRELGGELSICNLEKVRTKEEAIEAKVVLKRDLKMLRLVWGTNQHNPESDVADGLEPHRNLGALAIIDHGGSTGPSWLCRDIRIEMLHLEGVCWVTFPPFGKLIHLTFLTLRRISGLRQIRPGFGGVTDESFLHLRDVVLDRLPDLIEWVGVPNAHSFSRLENIFCGECPNLCALPFLQECSASSYSHLRGLRIHSCPKLFLPPMPHTSTITSVGVTVGPSVFSPGIRLLKGRELTLKANNSALAWHNMADRLEVIRFEMGPDIPWEQLSKLTYLRRIEIVGYPRFLSIAPLSNLKSLTSLELTDCDNITVDGCNPLITAFNLKNLEVCNRPRHPHSMAAYLLSDLVMAIRAEQLLPAVGSFFRLERLEVDSISSVLVAPICSLLAATLTDLIFRWDNRVESMTEEEEKALQLLTSLKYLHFTECQGLPCLPQGLHSLSSLKKLHVYKCDEIRSLPKKGIPTSLRDLLLQSCSSELNQQVRALEWTNQDLQVKVCY